MPRQDDGFLGQDLVQLSGATKLPAAVSAPTIRATAAVILVNKSVSTLLESTSRATMTAAVLPKPCNRATICGIWIIFTFVARTSPKQAPTAMDAQTSGRLTAPLLNRIMMMAPAMAAAPKWLPRTAVPGLFMRCRFSRVSPDKTRAAREYMAVLMICPQPGLCC